MKGIVTLICIGFFFFSPCTAQPDSRNSENVHFITTDIDAFWKAFDLFKKDTTNNPFADYLKNGTAGLHDFLEHRIKDSASFKKVIRNEISYYEKIRASSYRMLDYQDRVRSYYAAFRKIYPEGSFPDIYFVIGQLNSASASSPDKIMIGMEEFADNMFLTSTGSKSISMERLPLLIAGTLAFHNQKPAHTGFTLLRQCIILGSSDFLATLIVSDDKSTILNQPNYIYGEQHEESLVKQFLRQKNSDDFSEWLFHSGVGDKPRDLGFWIGYKITEAYYNNAPDKMKAINDILKINDFEKFLLLSGYAEPFKN
jgi:hypothetical protein